MRFAAFLLSLAFTVGAHALEAPRYMLDHSSSFVGRSLGYGCYAFEIQSDHLFCNPAQIAKDRDRTFSADFFLGQNFKKITAITDLVTGKANRETVQSLFGERRSSEIESNLDLGYIGPTWGIALTPLQVKYYSLYRNSALPEITLFAAKSKIASAQVGTYIENDFFLGLQGDFEQMDYVSTRFFLTDAVAEDANSYLSPQSQSNIYLTPSILWAPEGHEHKPEVGLTLSHFRITNRENKDLPSIPQYHLAGSFQVPLEIGALGFGGDFVWDENFDRVQDAVTLASFYEFGVLRLMGHYSEYSKGLGFLVTHKKLSAGVNYTDRVYFEDPDNGEHARNVYIVLRLQI